MNWKIQRLPFPWPMFGVFVDDELVSQFQSSDGKTWSSCLSKPPQGGGGTFRTRRAARANALLIAGVKDKANIPNVFKDAFDQS